MDFVFGYILSDCACYIQHYVGRYRLVAQSLLSLGKNVPSSPSEMGQPGELKLDAGLKVKELAPVQKKIIPTSAKMIYLFSLPVFSLRRW